jgi:hypothetical protein
MLISSGPFRRAALKGYISQMSNPNPTGLFDEFVAEILEQQGFTWEESPRSVYDPQQLYTALERYATDWKQFEYLDDAMRYGFRKAYAIFAKPKAEATLQPLTDSQVVSKALKLQKSSGLPLMTSKEKSLSYSFDREYQVRLGMKAPNPCVAYKRTQANNKTRLVWGYPLEMTIMESRFARPLINRFMRMQTPMAFGMTKCELGAKLHRYFQTQPGTTVCLDYSKYDSTLSATMIRQAFRILATWFEDADREALGWDTVVRYFINTPIVMPDGHLYKVKHHGVPSGSYFTQMIDSIVNVALCYALRFKFDLRFKPEALYVLGDDVIMQVRKNVDLKKWANYLSEYGLIIHDDEKTVVGQVHFLGAVWHNGKPDAQIEELVNKACFPESFRDYQGQPDTGAMNVLRSYASSYLSGYRFIPMSFAKIRGIDLPSSEDTIHSKWLSGSDKYIFEEKMVACHGKRYSGLPSLSVRLLS